MKLALTAMMLLCWVSSFAQGKELVKLYAYHLKPPFLVNIEKEKGLYYDLASYLTQHNEQYEFHTVFMPRKRLDRYLHNNQLDGPVLGVNPIWFQDKEEKTYLWTSKIFIDQDEFVSTKTTKFEFTGVESLHGKIFGGIAGFRYFGVDELVRSKKIQRVDTIGEDELLEMIFRNRVDTGIISRSTFNYITAHENSRDNFYLSAIPHDKYERRILVPQSQQAVFNVLKPIIEKLYRDPQWQKIIEQYH